MDYGNPAVMKAYSSSPASTPTERRGFKFLGAIFPNRNRNRDRNRENDLSWVDPDFDFDFDFGYREMSNARKSPKARRHSTSLCFSNHPSTDLINGFFNHG
jgi:hypothetical protein